MDSCERCKRLEASGIINMEEREAFKSYCDGNRAPWVERRMTAIAYRMLMALAPHQAQDETKEKA